MVQVGPQWFHWILKWSQTVPESPRRPIKFQKNSQVLPFSGIDFLLAPPGDLGVVAFLNLMIISSLVNTGVQCVTAGASSIWRNGQA